MYKILVADAINEIGLQPLMEMENATIIQKKADDPSVPLNEIDAILVRSATQVDDVLMEKMTNLKIVARAGVGVDNIDIKAATKRGIIVVNAPDGNTISTTEHTFAMMASLMRNIPQAHHSLKQYEWKRNEYVGSELYGKTLGVIGFGRIGSELAKRARVFGMNIRVFDPFLSKERAEKLRVIPNELDELLANSDIITVHTPLTKETRGLINEEKLAKTKQGVYLLNCARGGIIDETALIKFLENGHIAGVALDVFETEPPGEHQLLNFDNVIATPHLGASTKEAQLNVATQVANEVRLFLEDKPVSNSINLPSMSKDIYEKIKPYHNLAKQMGRIVSQSVINDVIYEMNVTYSGNVVDLETNYLTKTILSGFFTGRIDLHVNEVNAMLAAKERHLTVGEKISTNTHGYANCISIAAKGEKGTFVIRGTVIDHYGPRIIFMEDFNIDFSPHGNMLYVKHMDRPGVIGRVGRILGDNEINIAAMQVGRKTAGGEAIMILTFDKTLCSDVIDLVSEQDDIISIRQYELS